VVPDVQHIRPKFSTTVALSFICGKYCLVAEMKSFLPL